MARLKRKKAASNLDSCALPAHTRLEEWNGFKRLDPVIISPTTRKGSNFIFLSYLTQPNGASYVEVLEQQRCRGKNGPRLIRTVEPERVRPLPMYIRKRLAAKKSEAKEE